MSKSQHIKHLTILKTLTFYLITTLFISCDTNNKETTEPIINTKVSEADLLRGLVVADFGASWCGPCRTMEPIFKKVSEEMKASATFLKIDVDAHSTLSQKYGIKSIPTFLILKDGEVVEKKVGILSAEELKRAVEKWAGES